MIGLAGLVAQILDPRTKEDFLTPEEIEARKRKGNHGNSAASKLRGKERIERANQKILKELKGDY